MTKAIFLDRDGTLIKDFGYISSKNQIEILDGVLNGLELFKKRNYDLHVVSNQSGIARGLITFEEFREVDFEFKKLFASQKVKFNSVSYCLHGPENKCICRKPNTGMLNEIVKNFCYVKKNIAMIGNSDVDKGAAQNFGVLYSEVSEERKDFLEKALKLVQHFDAKL